MYTDTISCIVINEHYPGINPIQFGYQYCEPKWAYGTVIRDYWLLHYVVYGCGVLKLGGQEYSVKAGEMFVIPPGVASFYEADEKDPWFYIWVGFTTDMRLPSSMTQPVVPCKGIELYFKEMQKCETMKRGRSAYLNSCIWKIYSFFLDANYLNKHSEAEELNDPVSQATHYINSNYMEPIKVEDIAKLLHLDRTYFSALFTKKMGISPKKFLTAVRIKRAVELLKNGKSITETAYFTGYPNVYYFSRAFKKSTKFTPSEYRNKFGNKDD